MTTLSLRERMLGEGTPAVIVPLIGTHAEALAREAAAAASSGADVVEWRLDALLCASSPDQRTDRSAGTATARMLQDLAPAAQAIRAELGDVPLLLTVRTAVEGGPLEIDETRYRELLEGLIRSDWGQALDVEELSHPGLVADLSASATAHRVALVASHHRFDTTPPAGELDLLLQRLADSGADIIKLAVMPETPQQVLDLMCSTRRAVDASTVPVITMSMGPLGAVSRLAGTVTGSAATFAALGEVSAPGQLPVALVRSAQEAMR